jgi:hypothetical protein
MTEYDNIVVAAQEHAAKHAGAFCTCVQKMADALSADLAYSINHISAVYVTGIVRKSSSVIQMGLVLVEILETVGI